MNPILIIWTSKNIDEARSIASVLLERHLIACASIIPKVESLFRWEGSIESAQESKVFFKTDQAHFAAVRDVILKHASYEIPEILSINIANGNPAYFKWMEENLQ